MPGEHDQPCMPVTYLTLADLRRVDQMDVEERLKELEKSDQIARWQRHHLDCLELAMKLSPASPEQAIEFAEKLSAYILTIKKSQ